MKLCMPDKACVGISVENAQTGRKTSYNGRIVDVTNPMHQKALRAEGAFPASLLGARPAGGFRCAVCSFASFFRICGRCGAECERETGQ